MRGGPAAQSEVSSVVPFVERANGVGAVHTRERAMNISPVLAATHAVTRRIRAARALRAGTTTLAPGLAGLAVALAASRLGGIEAADVYLAAALAIAVPIAITLASAWRRIPAMLAADLVDRTHALRGRTVAALELSPADVESPLAALAVADALAHAHEISPARAFPIARPLGLRALLLASLTLCAASTLTRPIAPRPEPTAPRLAPLLVHVDDLALEHSALDEIETRSDPTPELRRAIDDTNALLEALEDRSVDRAEALRAIGELTTRLDRPRPTSLAAREERLEAIGDRIGSGQTTADLALALREADADRAQRAIEALADRLRAGSMSAEERRALREALAEARASAGDEETTRDIEDAERAVEEQRAQPQGEDSERLLEQREEAVRRLREQHEQRMQAEQELERLERELGQAADSLSESGEGDEEAAQSLDEAAEDLNRTAREQGSEEQMRELAEQLRQLREMIRRRREQQEGGDGEDGEGGEGSGRGSSGGASAMDRFVLRAGGGESGTEGTRIGVRSGSGGGEEGETDGSEGQGGEDDRGTPGGTRGSARGEDGEGGEGGEGGETEQVLVLGDEGGGSAVLELPGFGRRGTGDAQGGGDGEGDRRGGSGSEHDPTSLVDPTDRSGDHRTVAVHGEDQGRGPGRSEVIRGGAARGFASRDYERVYADYEAHAARAIEEDEIPPGYRFYVRRYFDLIRPRD